MKFLSILLLAFCLGSTFAVLNNRRAAVAATSTQHTEESQQAESGSAVGYQYIRPSAQHGVQYQAPSSAHNAAISHSGNAATFVMLQDYTQSGGGYATQQQNLDARPTPQAETANYGYGAGESYANDVSADNTATSDNAAPAIQQIPFQAQRFTQSNAQIAVPHADYSYEREQQQQQQVLNHHQQAQYQPQEQQQEHFQNGGFLQNNNHFETQAPHAAVVAPQYTDSNSKFHHNPPISFTQPYPQQNVETSYATAGQSASSAAAQPHVFSPGQQFASLAADGHYPYTPAVGSFAAQTSALSAAAYVPAHFSVAARPAVSTTTPAAPVYAEGQKGLGHYSYAVNRPVALDGGADYKQSQPTSQLLTAELAHKTQSVRGDGFEYLQTQSDSYELPSYFTMHSEAPVLNVHQQNHQQQQAPYSSYLPPAAAHSEHSYAAAGNQPQSFYGAPTPAAAHQQQAPNRAFQAPYYK